MSEGEAFLVTCLIALALAAAWDAISGEFMPSVGGLFIGLIVGVMVFG